MGRHQRIATHRAHTRNITDHATDDGNACCCQSTTRAAHGGGPSWHSHAYRQHCIHIRRGITIRPCSQQCCCITVPLPLGPGLSISSTRCRVWRISLAWVMTPRWPRRFPRHHGRQRIQCQRRRPRKCTRCRTTVGGGVRTFEIGRARWAGVPYIWSVAMYCKGEQAAVPSQHVHLAS